MIVAGDGAAGMNELHGGDLLVSSFQTNGAKLIMPSIHGTITEFER